MPQPNALRLVVWIILSSSLLGALFAYAENRPHGIADFVNTELHGVLAGGLNGGILSSLEILVLRGAYGVPAPTAVSTLSRAALASLRGHHPGCATRRARFYAPASHCFATKASTEPT